jgi:hypothetical protein
MEFLAMAYMSKAVLLIHRFCDQLLSHICAEGRVRDGLWSILLEELLPRYSKTFDQVRFVLSTEREGNLITMNAEFSKTLDLLRQERQREAPTEASSGDFGITMNEKNGTTSGG